MTVVRLETALPDGPPAEDGVPQTEAKQIDATKKSEGPCVCECTKKGLQDYRICTALEYYKNSSYHTFDTGEE